MTQPVGAPTSCRTCGGSRKVARFESHFVDPCPTCCCQVCGQYTDTPPVCAACDAADEAVHKRRTDT